MILKLSCYVDLTFNDDPALLPLVKDLLEELLLEEAMKTFSPQVTWTTEGLFEETPKDFNATDFLVKPLHPKEVRFRQLQLIKEAQSSLNKKKQLQTSKSVKKPKQKEVSKPVSK